MERSVGPSTTPTGRRTLFLALILVLGVTAAACGGGDMTGDGAAATGAGELDFVAETIDGAQLDAGDLEGQDVVLWFWAPW